MLLQGITAASSMVVGYHPLGGGLSGLYQAAMACWVTALIMGFGWLWRIALPDSLAAAAAIALGVGLGLLSLDIRYHLQDVVAVANPIEHMFAFAAVSAEDLGRQSQVLTSTLALTLLKDVASSLANHTFIFRSSHRPTLMLEWLTWAGLFVAWRRGDRLIVVQAGLLILAAWGLDAIFVLRGLKQSYFAYSDPLLIVAAALTAERFPELQASLRAQKVMFAVFGFYILWAHAEPLKATLSRRAPQEDCEMTRAHVRRVPAFPFCQS